METAWSFREPDRIPIELRLSALAGEQPEARRLVEFAREEADNFLGVGGFDWGFFGLDSEYREEELEGVPGEFKRMKRIHSTCVGEFYAVTRHKYAELNAADYHWERRYVHTIEELERLGKARRGLRPFDRAAYDEGCVKNGDRGISATPLFHPLGRLVRWANMEEVYIWMKTEKKIFHKFLESLNRQVADSVLSLEGEGIRPVFMVTAHEMLIPPWMGMDAFEELVFPYDKAVNDAVHGIGGRVRAHCHGNSGGYLERFAEMGIDALEPLEPPPYGDNDLADAKGRVGDRMLLSGNIVSQDFLRSSNEQVRESVRNAIRAAGPGGGYTLRCTGGNCGTGGTKDLEQLRGFLEKIEVYLDAALEFGEYPI